MVSTLLGAGHETTVISLGWIFLQLATHLDSADFASKCTLRWRLIPQEVLA